MASKAVNHLPTKSIWRQMCISLLSIKHVCQREITFSSVRFLWDGTEINSDCCQSAAVRSNFQQPNGLVKL